MLYIIYLGWGLRDKTRDHIILSIQTYRKISEL